MIADLVAKKKQNHDVFLKQVSNLLPPEIPNLLLTILVEIDPLN